MRSLGGIAAYGETALKTGLPSQATANPKGDQPATDELKRLSHQEEMQAAVTEMRGEHIQMQRKLIERNARIAELEQLVLTPVPVEHTFPTWIEFADTVQCDRTTLLNTVKPWSLQERQSLSVLLVDYLSEDQSNLDQVAWVPDKLLNSALSKLSFTVTKISGPDNMIDAPELEYISGCRFVSVQHLGVRRPLGTPVALLGARVCRFGLLPPATPLQSPRPHWTHREQWLFEGYGGRMLTVFGRDDFKIE